MAYWDDALPNGATLPGLWPLIFFETIHLFSTSVSHGLPCSLFLILCVASSLSLPLSGFLHLPFLLRGLSRGLPLGSTCPQLLWISGLSPPSLVSLSQLPKFPPLPATSHWPGPLFLSLCPPCRLRVTPAPCRAGSLSAVPPAPLSWAGWGIPPGSWKKQLGPRERPSVSPGARPPPSGLGVSP